MQNVGCAYVSLSAARVFFRALVRIALILGVLGVASPRSLWAQGVLESPPDGSFQSGVSFLSGWVCNANQVSILINGIVFIAQAAYRGSRADTQFICGDSDNGFAAVINWNLFGDGVHVVRILADGVEVGAATVAVTTLGSEFLVGASGECKVRRFPERGTIVTVEWQQSSQNFVIVEVQTWRRR